MIYSSKIIGKKKTTQKKTKNRQKKANLKIGTGVFHTLHTGVCHILHILVQ